MSVINSMLRDLDRRHAPSPFKGNTVTANVQPALAQPKRFAPRSAIALCVLIVLVILSWGQHFKKPTNGHLLAPIVTLPADKSPLPPGEGKGEGKQLIEIPDATTSPSSALGKKSLSRVDVKIKPEEKSSLTPAPLPEGEGKTAHETKATAPTNLEEKPQVQSEIRNTAPIIKQERKTIDDLTAERYQLARTALIQNEPQRAYELLRDKPPALLSNTDYHAVLAAVEQQLGHYADANLRYQQLLSVDQNQSSWWLGLALSLEGEHRSNEALAAYRRAAQLNSLPEAAHQYVAARIAALNLSAEQ